MITPAPSAKRAGFLAVAGAALAMAACSGEPAAPAGGQDPNGQSAFAFHREGMDLYRRGEIDAAALSLAKAAELKPDYLEAQYYAGKCFLNASRTDLEKASTHLAAALELKPDHMDARMELSRAYFLWGRYEEARKNLDQLLELYPDHRAGLYYAGIVASRTGDYEASAGFLRRTLAHEPGNTESWIELGAALGHLGRDQEGLEAYEHVLKLAPGHIRALMGAGTSLQRLGREEESRRYLGDFKEAQGALEKAEMKMKRMRVRLSTARRAYEEGRVEDGEKEVRLFREEFSMDPDALAELGAMQAGLARVEDAEKTFLGVLEIAPAHWKANEMLMELYRRIGDIAKSNAVNTRYRRAIDGAAAARRN